MLNWCDRFTLRLIMTDLDVFVEVDRLVVDVVLHEVVVDTAEQGHLGQGEDVHELLHGVTLGALQHPEVRGQRGQSHDQFRSVT